MPDNTIHTRLKIIMDKENLNYRSLGQKLGFSDVVVSNIIKGRNKPSFDFIYSLIQTFDWINIKWLFTGQENLTPDNYLLTVNDEHGEYKVRKEESADLIHEKEKRIQNLLHQINEKDAQIKDLLSILKQK